MPAHAQDLGYSSSGTLGVTVIIQPLGDAARADSQLGAVGLWTFAGANPGMMISGPSATVAGGTATVSLLAQTVSALTVRSTVTGSPLAVRTERFGRELRRTSTTLNVASSYAELGDRNSQMYIIGTI
ncbi:hypothetical protein CVO77_09125 [Sphingopyxis lindanitolerans]|uniref:Uncharacterized protein n=1 Tax=Sphingopyxis lindanitolerans TaxID=2054227 RepID=A0A2S8B860_9SPHN|nr:hypothetical protein [Sphingopyxis lindanitolerans]PQM28594.1 hypothetical protein CVO77_09125 [Sphingopyxis lindanitolerans]